LAAVLAYWRTPSRNTVKWSQCWFREIDRVAIAFTL